MLHVLDYSFGALLSLFPHISDEPIVISLYVFLLCNHRCPVGSSSMLIPALFCEQQKKMQIVFGAHFTQKMLDLGFVCFFLCTLYCKQHNQPPNVQLGL